MTACGEVSTSASQEIVVEDNVANLGSEEGTVQIDKTQNVQENEDVFIDKVVGEWHIDEQKTEENLKNYTSLQEMFGTGLGMGNGMEIKSDKTMSYYIGIGQNELGEGNYEVDNSDTGDVITVTITVPYTNSDGDTLTLHYEIEEDAAYLIMEYLGEELYWTQQAVDASGQTDTAMQENDLSDEYVYVENPSWEYYRKNKNTQVSTQSLHITQVSEQENQITDTEKWFADNGLDMSDYNATESDIVPLELLDGLVCSRSLQDDTYAYGIFGDNYASGYLLKLYDKKSGRCVKTIDFSSYRYADDFKESEWDYVEQRLWWVQTRDNILYASIGHNTYASSSPHTGYIVAIDLTDTSVMWKTEPLTSNAYNFEIIGDNLVCGYGFTAEPDYLKILDLHTGIVQEEIPVKSMADYIIQKDNVLYVRTYNTDYTFQIKE